MWHFGWKSNIIIANFKLYCQVLSAVVATVYAALRAVLIHTEEILRYYSVLHDIAAHLLVTTVTVHVQLMRPGVCQ